MSTTRPVVAVLAALSLPLLMACEEKAPTTPAKGPAPAQKRGPVAVTPPATPAPENAAPGATPPAGESGGSFSVEGLSFKTPEGWKKVAPANPMRLAELHTAESGGALVVFSSAGGDIPANIARWSAQFQGAQATTSERTVAGLKVHTVDIAGTYSGMNEAAQNNYALHGAIIETGGQPVFVKMTGAEDAVKAAAPAFDAMIDGMTK